MRGGIAGVQGEPVVVGELPDREVVGDDTALEAPRVAEKRRQQLAVGGARDAVDLVVRVHHGADAGADRGLERMEVDVVELPRRNLAGAQFFAPSEAP